MKENATQQYGQQRGHQPPVEGPLGPECVRQNPRQHVPTCASRIVLNTGNVTKWTSRIMQSIYRI
jgi:hypothetical protein